MNAIIPALVTLLTLAVSVPVFALAPKTELKREGPRQIASAFILQALKSKSSSRAKFYLSADGKLQKTTVYVDKSFVPTWAFQMADKMLGAGDDKEYEVEEYGTGDHVYEITRIVNGKELELALRVNDQKALYIEHEGLSHTELPAPVKKALVQIKGFTVTTVTRAERNLDAAKHTIEYSVKGTLAGQPTTVRFAENGRELERRKALAAEVELSQ